MHKFSFLWYKADTDRVFLENTLWKKRGCRYSHPILLTIEIIRDKMEKAQVGTECLRGSISFIGTEHYTSPI